MTNGRKILFAVAVLVALAHGLAATSAATVYRVDSSNRYVGLSSDTKPSTATIGSIFQETDTGRVYVYSGSAWVVVDVTPHTTGVSTRLTAENTWTTAFSPAPGKFAFTLNLTGSPTVHLQRAVDINTTRVGSITGTTALELTTGTLAFIQTGMFVTGTGIPDGTTVTYVTSTTATLSQACTNGTGIALTFWVDMDGYTASTAQIVEWPRATNWRAGIKPGNLGGGTCVANFFQ